MPVTTIDKSKVEPGSQSILQAFTFRNDGELMFTFGGAANDPQDAAKMKVDPREIVGVDIKTGKVLSDDQLDFAHNKAYGVTQATSAEPEGITVTNDRKGVFVMVGTWQKGINYDDKTPQDMSGKIYFIPFKNATTSTSNNNHQSNNNKPANGASHSTNGTSKLNSGTNKPTSGTNSNLQELIAITLELRESRQRLIIPSLTQGTSNQIPVTLVIQQLVKNNQLEQGVHQTSQLINNRFRQSRLQLLILSQLRTRVNRTMVLQ